MKRISHLKKFTICFFILLACLCLLPVRGQTETEQTLFFYNTHTHERLTVTYKKGDIHIPEAMNYGTGIAISI
ncbi:MAG: hypothetical protein GY850_41115 [bacterium]|nr:hypothetical protein [bacterium]